MDRRAAKNKYWVGGCACCIVSGNTECVRTCRHSHCLMQCRGGAEQCSHMYVTAPAAVIYVSLYGGQGGGGSRRALRVRGLGAYPGNEVIVACRDLRRLSPLSPGPAPPPPNATLPQLHVKSPSICVLIRALSPIYAWLSGRFINGQRREQERERGKGVGVAFGILMMQFPLRGWNLPSVNGIEEIWPTKKKKIIGYRDITRAKIVNKVWLVWKKKCVALIH